MADLVSELGETIERERRRFAVPGCAVLVVAAGEVVLCDGFGVRDLASGDPVTRRTLFPIASATKTFTAALCGLLVEAGLLDWHRPAREYLPELRMTDPVADAQMTLFDMLSHRSGLPRHDLLWYAGADRLSRTDLVRALAHLEPNLAFREAWQYNNMVYTAAGELAGRAAGQSYEAALYARVLDPLGMRRTTLSASRVCSDADHAVPYVAPEPDLRPRPVPFVDLDVVAPAGGLNSCVADLVPWLRSLLGRGVSGRAPLLPADLRAALQTPAMPLPARSPLAVGEPVGYGLGMIVEDYRGHRVVHHGGNIDGFSSQVSLVPGADCAVAVLTNRDSTGLRDALPYLIYDRLLELPPRPHGPDLLARERAILTGREEAHQRLRDRSVDLPAVRPARDYVGRYRHPGYGEFTVTERDGGLYGSYQARGGPLEHRHLEVFTLVADLGGVPVPVPVRFLHDMDAEVVAVTVAMESAVPPIRFERVPDTAHLTDEVLDGLAGEYRRGPLRATVARRGASGLVATIVSGPPTELTPVRDLVFRIGADRVEFTDDGRLLTPAGDFDRATGQASG